MRKGESLIKGKDAIAAAFADSYVDSYEDKWELLHKAVCEGYRQAEKDLKEWVEEQLTILDKQTLLHPDDDVFWGQRNAYKQMKDKLNSL